MATWIKQPWIENALKSGANSLPKIARAQVLKLEETSNIAVISDKKLFVKAEFSPTAIKQLKRDNASLQLSDIQGGLIFVKKYSVRVTAENDLENAEFVIKIDEFKFAGGEGNTQFGRDVIDSSTHPQLKSRLWQLWRAEQLRAQLVGGEALPDSKEAERLLLGNHKHIFIPDDIERKLAELPEWKSSYVPPQTCEMQSDISSLEGQVQEQSCPNSADLLLAEWKSSYVPPQTCEMQSDISSLEGQVQEQSCPNSTDLLLAGHTSTEKELESQECPCENEPFVSSTFVPSSQRDSCMPVKQPLKGLFPEELFSSSLDDSQIRGSSEESYSILKRRSSVVPSSQNSHEFELQQELPHIFPERKQFQCSLSESQLVSFLHASFSAGSPSIQEEVTQVKARDASQIKQTSSEKSKSVSESSHLRRCGDNEPSLVSSGCSEKKTRSNTKDSDGVTEVVVVSPSRNNVRKTVQGNESLEKVDFDTLFSQNTWKLSQSPVREFSAEEFEVDKRQSIKRKRTENDDSKRKLPGLSDGFIKIRRLSFPDNPVSPDGMSGSLKASNQSVSSPPSNQSFTKPGDLYTQQDPLLLDTSGSTESLQSPQNHENSPSILHISMEEPCTMSTPNFASLPSYQVPAETKAQQFIVTPSPSSHDQRDEGTPQLIASTTQRGDAGPPQEPGASWDIAENVVKPAGVKKKRKARRRFNWFADDY